MKLKHRKSKRPFFSPDDISTRISQALNRDLEGIKQKYDTYTPPITLSADIQSRDLLKKYIPENCVTEKLRQDAFDLFKHINDHMLSANVRFLEHYPDYEPKYSVRTASIIQSGTSERDRALLRAKHLIANVLGTWTIEELFTESKHSAGSSIGVPFTDTSLEKKFQYPMSATRRVGSLMDQYLVFDNQTKQALDLRAQANPLVDRYDYVDGARATTVRKTALKDRMIAVEPTVNMFFQQGLMAMIYDRMRKVNLDVETLPDMHKWRARISSVTSKEATIDWSSASDCVSVELLRFLLPPRWFDIVDRVRSPAILLGDEWIRTQMISTMGNAVTFPLETLVFWAIGKSVVFDREHPGNRLLLTKEEILKPDVSVFGDDCIVPTQHAHRFIDVCVELGFIVNKEKSFYNENETFRESCGGDYLSGYNVRPFCLKAPTGTSKSALEPWLYICFNALIPRYIQYFGALNWCYSRDLLSLMEVLFVENDLKLKIVPDDFPDDSGLKIAFDLERILACYAGLRSCLSRVSKNVHGQYTFLYCRYVYRDTGAERCLDLRYAAAMKKPKMSRIPEVKSRNMLRQGGGYVVAKALTGRWSVPQLSGGPKRV